mmetsp:Transcript_13249/g.44558  ORF Transcript_13249/g.44558 Transcript_13249/m.44558 type:complete len:238 (-) Transcript_13249:1351-2064(-)
MRAARPPPGGRSPPRTGSGAPAPRTTSPTPARAPGTASPHPDTRRRTRRPAPPSPRATRGPPETRAAAAATGTFVGLRGPEWRRRRSAAVWSHCACRVATPGTREEGLSRGCRADSPLHEPPFLLPEAERRGERAVVLAPSLGGRSRVDLGPGRPPGRGADRARVRDDGGGARAERLEPLPRGRGIARALRPEGAAARLQLSLPRHGRAPKLGPLPPGGDVRRRGKERLDSVVVRWP